MVATPRVSGDTTYNAGVVFGRSYLKSDGDDSGSAGISLGAPHRDFPCVLTGPETERRRDGQPLVDSLLSPLQKHSVLMLTDVSRCGSVTLAGRRLTVGRYPDAIIPNRSIRVAVAPRCSAGTMGIASAGVQETMTPAEIRREVFPELIRAWKRRCFCASPGFQKLISFDFRDYDIIGPVGLADTEILIDEIIRERFTKAKRHQSRTSDEWPDYICPQCGAKCSVGWEDFSISMNRSVAQFDGDFPQSETGLYLVGFYGFDRSEFARIKDFRQTVDAEEYRRFITGQ